LMFEGYSDSLLTLGSMFAAEGGIPMDKFGWFYKRNGTTWSDGVVTMATGTQNFQEVGNIKLWKGSNRTIYPSYCGDLRGTSAGFTAFTEKDRNYIDFFSTDICRPIRFDRDQEIDIRGVKGTRFSLNATKTFGNAETNPENSCYHANLPTGVHNSTGCKGGDTTLKTFVSLPHFLGADPFFIEQFEEGSIQPDGDRHSASMTLEMDTAIPIQVLMRLQIILQIRPNPNIGTFFEHLPEVFLPVIWFDAEAVIDEENASQIQMLSVLPSLAIQFGYVSLVGCSICILALIIFRTRQTGTSRQQDSKVDMDVDMSSNTLRASSVKMDSSELQTKKL